MIVLGYLEGGGHRIKLPDGPTFTEPASGMKLNEWVDLVIEYRQGEIRVVVNGHDKTYKHQAYHQPERQTGPQIYFPRWS